MEMNVRILSPTQGGPYFWAENLTAQLNHHRIRAVHTGHTGGLLASPFIRDADIIHAAVPLFCTVFVKPLVLTIKGDIYSERKRWLAPYFLAMRRADAITTPSRYLSERLHLEDAHVIPNAISPQNYRTAKQRDRPELNIITVTNFAFRDKSEGVLQIIRILEQVQKTTDAGIRFTIVGGGPFLAQVKKEAGSTKIPVRFTGFISQPGSELEQADLFLYYSSHDNFPNAILEAMASGLPIVTNDVGAVREIIDSGSTGFVAGSDEEYKETVARLIINTELRAEQGRNARKRVEEHFNWEQIVPEYIKIYQDLLSRR